MNHWKSDEAAVGRNRDDCAVESLAQALAQLGEEVARASDRLAEMLRHGTLGVSGMTRPTSLEQRVVATIRAREARGRTFVASLFSDPAWDILLHLLLAELRQYRVSFTQLAAHSKLPPTTAHRWVFTMLDRGMLNRHDDPLDSRRSFVELHPETSAKLRRFFDSLDSSTLV